MIKYKKLTGALIGIVEDYSLVNYMTLNVEVCLIYLLPLTPFVLKQCPQWLSYILIVFPEIKSYTETVKEFKIK